MTVKVLAGWAWINGYWYHNDNNLVLNVTANATAQTRIDGVFIRWDSNTRQISTIIAAGRTTPVRTSPYYELKIAEIAIPTGATQITDANITDTRSDSSVCGFVTGVVDVIDSGDLFAQFTSTFNTWLSESQEEFDDWFDEMKDQLSSDAAGHLQNEIDALQSTVEGLITISGNVLVINS